MAAGKVYIVGAGPGNPELLTIKALKVFQCADVVIYDRLVSKAVLDLVRKEAVRIYAGKTPGLGSMQQEKINKIMLKEIIKGKTVLRLKGGDPFLFSRGGEEVEFLRAKGLEVEVVPGVTSAIGASTFAGIPLTYRGYSSSLSIVTGHSALSRGEKNDSIVDWSKLATASDTIVILMGLENFDSIAKSLIQAGLSASTPAAVIEWGTTDHQKVLLLTLSEAADRYRSGYVQSPGLIVIGRTVLLAPKIAWYHKGKVRASPGYLSAYARNNRGEGNWTFVQRHNGVTHPSTVSRRSANQTNPIIL